MARKRRPARELVMAKRASQPRRVSCHTGRKSCSLSSRSPGRPARTGSGSRGSTFATSVAVTAMGQLRVGVPDPDQVGGAGPGAELVQEVVAPLAGMPGGHLGLGVAQVPEADGLGRAGLLAGGLDLAVLDAPPGPAGRDALPLDALHAVGAFLHDATRAHRDVRVHEHLLGGRLGAVVLEEVEAPDL